MTAQSVEVATVYMQITGYCVHAHFLSKGRMAIINVLQSTWLRGLHTYMYMYLYTYMKTQKVHVHVLVHVHVHQEIISK